MNLTTKELEDELARRREKHNIRVGGTVIALNFDEMEEVQKQIEKFLKPAPVEDYWIKQLREFQEAAGKAKKEKPPYFPPPINVPNWPSYEPFRPEPRPFRENQIWCKDEMGG